jgi:Domain of unknown function (DUF932)
MNHFTLAESLSPACSHAFGPTLSIDELRRRTPAVFAGNASTRTKLTYRFINTAGVLAALLEAGFEPSAAQQTRSRAGSDPAYARHMIRLRSVRESITLVDCIPEICLINAHDGTSAYQLLAGLYRPLCTNGLLCRMGDFAIIRIPHRANIIADVVAGALKITAQFARIGSQVTAMAARVLSDREQVEFAQIAYEIRWAKVEARPAFLPSKMLEVRRATDAQPSLWHTFNRLQESAMTGGILYHTRAQRLMRTRRIRNIREDVRINTALWQAAVRILEA